MSTIIQPLFAPIQLTAAAATYFTAQAATRIDKLTVSNPSSTIGYTATIYWVPTGGTAGTANAIQTTRRLQPLETWDVWPFIGHVLKVGDTIQALASVTTVLNFFGSGTVVTG